MTEKRFAEFVEGLNVVLNELYRSIKVIQKNQVTADSNMQKENLGIHRHIEQLTISQKPLKLFKPNKRFKRV